MAKRRPTKPVPIAVLSKTFRVPSRGIAVDYPGREVLLKSRITNIALNGVFVATPTPFAKGSTLDITFQIPTSDTAISASCVVRWSTATDPSERPADIELDGMGLEFTAISRKDRKAVEHYIKEFLTRIRKS